MKILEKSIRPVLLLITICISSCNQQEFYEKEFLEGAGVPDEKVVPPIKSTPSPGVCGNGTAQNTSDQFMQNITQQGKVDIVWVIDNSGSMKDEQDALATNFSSFIQDFIQKGVDFQMAVTTTDARSSFDGRMVSDPTELTSVAATQDEVKFMADFQNAVKVGTDGSGNEAGLQTSESFMTRYNSWLRDDAFLIIVYLSDEQDHSSQSVQHYIDTLKSVKTSEGMLKAYSIVTTELIPEKQHETLGTRYVELSQATGGSVADIHQDFHTTLTGFGESILNLLDSFPLSGVPINADIDITINGRSVTSGWTYDSNTRSIKFDQLAIPREGSIVIAYYQKCVGS